MRERWRAVVGWEGWYDVSTLGRVRRMRRAKGTSVGRIVGTHLGGRGYLDVRLYRPSGAKSYHVHALVAAAFLGPRPKGRQVNHKNGDKSDARLTNLEWVTPRQNVRHAHRNGLAPNQRGELNNGAKLCDRKVREIKRLLADGGACARIGRRFDVCAATIGAIKAGRTWTHTI